MSGVLELRRASAADLEALVEFNAAMALETEGKQLDPDVLRPGVGAVLEDPGKGSYWVAEQAGRVVGGLLVTLEWSDWRNGWFWWIQSVYVREEQRGRGVYRALYRLLERTARATPDVCGLRLYVETENQGAQAVYEKLGMQRAHYHMYETEFVPGAS